MPGSFQRPPDAGASWTLEQWTEYRDRHVAACGRWPEWANNVGRACVAMAEAHIARLSTAPALDGTPLVR